MESHADEESGNSKYDDADEYPEPLQYLDHVSPLGNLYMRHIRTLFRFGITTLAAISISATAAPETLDGTEFGTKLTKVDRVYLAGQPTEAGTKAAEDMGIETIISLRTPAETDHVAESELASELGMDFVNLPSGGTAYPFSPAEVSKFNEIMESTDGDVLLHCRSATRATHLYVAWLVNYQDVPLEEALKLAGPINFGSTPLEGYLGRKIEQQAEEE